MSEGGGRWLRCHGRVKTEVSDDVSEGSRPRCEDPVASTIPVVTAERVSRKRVRRRLAIIESSSDDDEDSSSRTRVMVGVDTRCSGVVEVKVNLADLRLLQVGQNVSASDELPSASSGPSTSGTSRRASKVQRKCRKHHQREDNRSMTMRSSRFTSWVKYEDSDDDENSIWRPHPNELAISPASRDSGIASSDGLGAAATSSQNNKSKNKVKERGKKKSTKGRDGGENVVVVGNEGDSNDSGRESPMKCMICLDGVKERSLPDICLHPFCYPCLLEWAKVKSECPLCKKPFTMIYYNIRADDDYDIYHVPPPVRVDPQDQLDDYFERIFLRNITQGRPMQDGRESQQYRILAAAAIQASHRAFSRLFVYNHNVWVYELRGADGEGETRVRAVTPQFLRNHPGQLHRIKQWLRREMSVLIASPAEQETVVDLSIGLLQVYELGSPLLAQALDSHISPHTRHFLHELTWFVRSPYDMYTYDMRAHYYSPPTMPAAFNHVAGSQGPPEVLDLVSSDEEPVDVIGDAADDDDEVEILEVVQRVPPSPPPQPPVTQPEVDEMSVWQSAYLSQQSVDLLQQSVELSLQSVDPSHQSVDPSQQSVDPSQQSVDPSQQSVVPSQQNVALSQQSVVPLQQSVALSQQSVDSSQQSLEERELDVEPNQCVELCQVYVESNHSDAENIYNMIGAGGGEDSALLDQSVDSSQQSVAPSQQSGYPLQQSVGLSQQSVDSTQESVEVIQPNVETNEDGVRFGEVYVESYHHNPDIIYILGPSGGEDNVLTELRPEDVDMVTDVPGLSTYDVSREKRKSKKEKKRKKKKKEKRERRLGCVESGNIDDNDESNDVANVLDDTLRNVSIIVESSFNHQQPEREQVIITLSDDDDDNIGAILIDVTGGNNDDDADNDIQIVTGANNNGDDEADNDIQIISLSLCTEQVCPALDSNSNNNSSNSQSQNNLGTMVDNEERQAVSDVILASIEDRVRGSREGQSMSEGERRRIIEDRCLQNFREECERFLALAREVGGAGEEVRGGGGEGTSAGTGGVGERGGGGNNTYCNGETGGVEDGEGSRENGSGNGEEEIDPSKVKVKQEPLELSPAQPGEITIVDVLPPRHLRTPVICDLSSDSSSDDNGMDERKRSERRRRRSERSRRRRNVSPSRLSSWERIAAHHRHPSPSRLRNDFYARTPPHVRDISLASLANSGVRNRRNSDSDSDVWAELKEMKRKKRKRADADLLLLTSPASSSWLSESNNNTPAASVTTPSSSTRYISNSDITSPAVASRYMANNDAKSPPPSSSALHDNRHPRRPHSKDGQSSTVSHRSSYSGSRYISNDDYTPQSDRQDMSKKSKERKGERSEDRRGMKKGKKHKSSRYVTNDSDDDDDDSSEGSSDERRHRRHHHHHHRHRHRESSSREKRYHHHHH